MLRDVKLNEFLRKVGLSSRGEQRTQLYICILLGRTVLQGITEIY